MHSFEGAHPEKALTVQSAGKIDLMKTEAACMLVSALWLAMAAAAPAYAQVDAEAAQALAKRNDCFKCHAIDKTKQGPAYKRVAARLKTKPDGVEVIVEHVTSGHMVQLEDGTEQNHKIIDTRDPAELRNLALWILSL
jgi:cytochrome c